MLDIKRLLKNDLLIKNGWSPKHKVNIKEVYARIYNQNKDKNSSLLPQVAIEKYFPRHLK